MEKRKIRIMIKRVRALKVWQLLILLVLTIFVAFTALRMNNVEMLRRKEAVQAADKELNLEKSLERLKELKDFSQNHMNSNTIVELKNIYESGNQKIIQEATQKANNHNITIERNARAKEICDTRFGGYNKAYVDCFVGEIANFQGENKIDEEMQFPAAELYVHSISSPIWTPDLAGWTVLTAIIIVLLIISKIVFEAILHILLKKHEPFI